MASRSLPLTGIDGGRASRGGARPALVATLAFCAVVSLISVRIVRNLNVLGEPNLPRYGLVDFRDAVYFPVVSFLDGNNPYDASSYARTYPVSSTFALYGPHTLLVHLPFGLLPLGMAEWLYFLVTVALMPLIALLVLHLNGLTAGVASVFTVAALLLLSRPGESNLFLGQYAATLCVGVFAALGFARRRPWLAGLGVAIAVLKPTFGVPLVVLMLARRDGRAVAIGLVVAAVLAAVPALLLTASIGGVTRWVDVLQRNQAVFGSTAQFGVTSSVTRIDVASLFGRLLGHGAAAGGDQVITLVMLAAAALAVHRLERPGTAEARRLSNGLVCVTVVCCVYHQGYDALLLALPLTALVFAPTSMPSLPQPLAVLLAILLAIPLLNYVSTFGVVEGLSISGSLWTAVTSVNAAVLLTAWVVYVGLALGQHGRLLVAVPYGSALPRRDGAAAR